MKISKRDAKLLLILLGLVVFLLSYLLVYNRYISKTDAINAKIAELQPQLTTLEDYNANLSSYEAGVAEAKVVTAEKLTHFPTQVMPEDQILYARELEKNVGIHVNDMTFSEAVMINEFQGITASGSENKPVTMDAYQSVMAMTCDLNYAQLKSLLHYVYQSNLCCGVPSLSVSYDATQAQLTGTVNVAQYAINYTGAPTSSTTMPGVALGQNNLFG
jgi:hypothetical protein